MCVCVQGYFPCTLVQEFLFLFVCYFFAALFRIVHSRWVCICLDCSSSTHAHSHFYGFFAGLGTIGRLGLLRRVQPHRAGGALRGGATDPDHTAGHWTQGCEILFRGYDAQTGSDLFHIHNHESRVSSGVFGMQGCLSAGNSSCGFTHRIFSALPGFSTFFFFCFLLLDWAFENTFSYFVSLPYGRYD